MTSTQLAHVVLCVQKKQDKLPLPEPQRILNEGQAQMEAFRYNPVALGKPIKTKQVSGVIEQPWYQRLMASGSFQVLIQLVGCLFMHSFILSFFLSFLSSIMHLPPSKVSHNQS